MVRLVFNRRHRHVSDPLSEASSAATVASWHFSDSGELGPCPVRVKSDGLAVGHHFWSTPINRHSRMPTACFKGAKGADIRVVSHTGPAKPGLPLLISVFLNLL
jgi:hypothetical protein